MPVRRVRPGALAAAALALVAARVWLYLAPGRAVRITAHGPTLRGSRGFFTGRGLRGLLNRKDVENIERDPRDPRPVGNPRDPRLVNDPRPQDPRISDLSRAVSALAVRAPFSATCLEQGIALVLLLSIARIPAHLVVGVSRAEPIFRAHAWVECGGIVVLGGAQARGLTPLPRPAASPSTVLSSCPG